jgi:hypothetical protein
MRGCVCRLSKLAPSRRVHGPGHTVHALHPALQPLHASAAIQTQHLSEVASGLGAEAS